MGSLPPGPPFERGTFGMRVFHDLLYIYVHTYTYIYLAVVELRCCMQAFSICSERGLLLITIHGLVIMVDSLVSEHRL